MMISHSPRVKRTNCLDVFNKDLANRKTISEKKSRACRSEIRPGWDGKDSKGNLKTTGTNCMPAKSKKQQMAAGAALAAKRGKGKKSPLRGASKGMYESMSKAELRRMAKTKRKGKPTRKTKKR